MKEGCGKGSVWGGHQKGIMTLTIGVRKRTFFDVLNNWCRGEGKFKRNWSSQIGKQVRWAWCNRNDENEYISSIQ